ncbi:MAG: hypothetical protein HYV26_17530 [Candidatus Hydrogenedentes bacterium]|nr:hypothetical protein [Candidatus Hydrogenedentota bacterium]
MSFVSLRSFDNFNNADLAASFLRSQGIRVEIVDETASVMLAGYVHPGSATVLQVPEQELKLAQELLEKAGT